MATIGRFTVLLLIAVIILATAHGVAIYYQPGQAGTIGIGIVAGVIFTAVVSVVDALSERTEKLDGKQ